MNSGGVFLALGGNVGDVLATFRSALAALAEEATIVLRRSKAYRTEALLPPGGAAQPDYWNAVCELRCLQSEKQFLATILAIEKKAGREGRKHWLPRPLDLDLLLWGDKVINEQNLRIPHPHLSDRVFVLRPLCDIAPWQVVPISGKTVRELLQQLPNPDAGIREIREQW